MHLNEKRAGWHMWYKDLFAIIQGIVCGKYLELRARLVFWVKWRRFWASLLDFWSSSEPTRFFVPENCCLLYQFHHSLRLCGRTQLFLRLFRHNFNNHLYRPSFARNCGGHSVGETSRKRYAICSIRPSSPCCTQFPLKVNVIQSWIICQTMLWAKLMFIPGLHTVNKQEPTSYIVI